MRVVREKYHFVQEFHYSGSVPEKSLNLPFYTLSWLWYTGYNSILMAGWASSLTIGCWQMKGILNIRRRRFFSEEDNFVYTQMKKIPFNIMVLKSFDKRGSIVSPWWSWTTWSWWWRGEQMVWGPSPRSWRWRCSPGCKTCPFADLKDRLWETYSSFPREL